jgi:MFS family permease
MMSTAEARTTGPDDPAQPASIVPPQAPPAVESPKREGRVGALRSPNFRLLWTGLVIANSGSWMATTAQGWLVTDLEPERASLYIGLIAMAFALPMLLLTMVGGAVADRFPRMRLLWIVQLCYLVFATALATITLLGLIEVWMLLVYSLLTGTVLAFDSPVRNALLPDLVDREHLAGAVSLNSAAYSGAALIGPAIAGGLIPLIGVSGVYTISAISVLAVLWALRQMEGVPEYAGARQPSLPIFQSIKQGVSFALDSRIIFGVLAVSVVSGIFARSYTPLLVIFARDEYQVGSLAYGVMVAAPGLGTLAAAFGIASRVDTGERGRKVKYAAIGLSLVMIAFAAMPWYAGGLPLLILSGMFTTLLAANMATILQLQAPPHLRGRLMSIYMLTLIGVPALGTLISGALADIIGVRLTVGIGAAILLVATFLIYLRNHELRAVE